MGLRLTAQQTELLRDLLQQGLPGGLTTEQSEHLDSIRAAHLAELEAYTPGPDLKVRATPLAQRGSGVLLSARALRHQCSRSVAGMAGDILHCVLRGISGVLSLPARRVDHHAFVHAGSIRYGDHGSLGIGVVAGAATGDDRERHALQNNRNLATDADIAGKFDCLDPCHNRQPGDEQCDPHLREEVLASGRRNPRTARRRVASHANEPGGRHQADGVFA